MTAEGLDYRLLFEASPDVLVVLRPDPPRYTMVAATESRLEVTHTTREQTIGRGIFELFPDNPDDATADGTSNLRASLDRVIATRSPDTMPVQKYDIRLPDGTFEVKYWSPKNIPVLSPQGEVVYVLHRVEDVSGLVRATEEGEVLRDRSSAMEREVVRRSRELAVALEDLRAANVKLGELDVAKTAFFNNVSHEFRTPLTLMLGPIEDVLAQLRHGAPELAMRLTLAHDNALRLLKLVNALLDFARLEAGRLEVSYAAVDLAQATKELAAMFDSAVSSAGLKLVIDCPATSELAWLDRDLWEKIVVNLVSNAFKFTLQGQIVVRLREELTAFVLEVADTGVGIPSADLSRVFERFHRVSGTTGRTHEGTGIGLSLVRELAELHGGRVEVESEMGIGTTFRVVMPRGHAHVSAGAAVNTAPRPPAANERRGDVAAHVVEAQRWGRDSAATGAGAYETQAPPNALARVLLVEDSADLRQYTSGLLAPFFEVTLAVDGQAGLEAARLKPPDIVVSDVMMPRLDGFGLVRALRAEPKTAHLPIILLSARAGEEAAIDGLTAGADDYLIKPFSAPELLARVRTHVELARARRALTLELERANRELDAFSYSVSHDLRAPLRAIDGFGALLAEECGHAVGKVGLDCIQRIRAATSRMSDLINGLLELARLPRGPLARKAVDLGRLAERVISDLRGADPERSVEVRIEPGLIADGDPRLLSVVVTNLLENAWKFTRRTEQPCIEVGRTRDIEPTFFVRDNGVGFDSARADNLFTPFQRLHQATEFAGTGIGLATVQRVIARHEGRIWADSAQGKGATFFFTLPAAALVAPLELREVGRGAAPRAS